jgi:hypothetical protein
MSETRFFIGLDLGQAHDYTAMAVLERAEARGAWDAAWYAYRKEVTLQLRYLERAPLGTKYTEVAARVRAVARRAEVAGRCALVADATGVGRPVMDLLRTEDLGCRLIPVTLTGGDSESLVDGYYRAPKRDVITGLQALLDTGALRIASRLEHGATLARELMEMQVKLTPAGREQYGAWRENQHDDLVLATALACWWARKLYPRPPKGDDRFVRAPEWMWGG